MSNDFNGTPLEDGEISNLVKKFSVTEERKEFRRYRGVFMPIAHSSISEKIENFQVRNDDIYVMGFPKTGTTWTQELVWCIANNLNFNGAKEIIPVRFPILELSSYNEDPDHQQHMGTKDSVAFADEMPSIRFIKTHLPWDSLPKQIRQGEKTPKIVYVCRNPKDACVSFYHFSVLNDGYTGNFDDFCKLFLNGAVLYGPFWPHIHGFWQKRSQPNVLFLTYEDMRKDLSAVIRQAANFLGKTLSDEEVGILKEHLSFKSMKENVAVNHEHLYEERRKLGQVGNDEGFMRKGTVGQWKETMSPKQVAEFDLWTEKNTAELGFDFWKTSQVQSA